MQVVADGIAVTATVRRRRAPGGAQERGGGKRRSLRLAPAIGALKARVGGQIATLPDTE